MLGSRLGSINMTAKRPAVVITNDLDIWIGNTSDAAITLGPIELFGFSTGTFEEFVSRGNWFADFFLMCAFFFA